MKPEKRLPSVPSVGWPTVPPANASDASTETHTYIISYIWYSTTQYMLYPESPCLLEQIKQSQFAGGDYDKWQYNLQYSSNMHQLHDATWQFATLTLRSIDLFATCHFAHDTCLACLDLSTLFAFRGQCFLQRASTCAGTFLRDVECLAT